MQHQEAYALLWLQAGARYERINVTACAARARDAARQRQVGRDPSEDEDVTRNPAEGGVDSAAVGRVSACVMEAIDTAEERLSALCVRLRPEGDPFRHYLTAEECVTADSMENRATATQEEVWGLSFEVAGAATAGFFRRSGEVFPSEEVSAAVATVLHDHGFRDPPRGYQRAVEEMERLAVERAVLDQDNDATTVAPKGHDGVGIPDRSKHQSP